MSKVYILVDSEPTGLSRCSAAMLAAAIQHSRVAVAICDADFRPNYFNAAAARLLSIADQQSAQHSDLGILDRVVGIDLPAVHAAIGQQGFWRACRAIVGGSSAVREADIEISSFLNGDEARLMVVARQVEPATSRNRLASDSELILVSGHLSMREKQVMLGLLVGQTSREIAERLAISPRTVEFHRAKLLRRYGAKSLVELIQRVIHDEKLGNDTA